MSLGQLGNLSAILNSTTIDPLIKSLLDSHIINFENQKIRSKASLNRKGATQDMEGLQAAFEALKLLLEQLKNRSGEPQIPEELPIA